MPASSNDHHLAIPQTPRAKTRFDDDNAGPDVNHGDSELKRDSATYELDSLRRYSASPLRSPPSESGRAVPGTRPAATWVSRTRHALNGFWQRNRAVLLVALSQLFGALMNLTARLLELEGEGMHPFQVLFARQSLTMIGCLAYMYVRKVPDWPLGRKEVRWLLVVRGMSGFFGIYGLWYSMMYLPLAEATVITFLAPSVAGYICHVVLHEPFTRVEQISSFVALGGVILIAHPTSLFSAAAAASSSPGVPPPDSQGGVGGNGTSALPGLDHETTAAERLAAIGVALLGVLGAAGAFTTIRWIGTRAHPLISVNYFATWATIVCVIVLNVAPLLDIGQPALRFALPGSVRQWAMLLFLGVFGFIMQFLMTKGLGMERSNRANAMVYTHMLFAAGFDRWVFGHRMGLVSLAGCGLIIGSALWAVLSKKPAVKKADDADVEQGGVEETEATPFMLDVDDSEEEEGDDLPSQSIEQNRTQQA